jgi:predicted nucleotidyltransferase component of viral defense system
MMRRRDSERLRDETGFSPLGLERVYHAVRVVKAFFADAGFAGRYALKGGTALAFCYLDVARLSFDVDLNYVASTDKAHMSAEREVDRRGIPDVVRGAGQYTVSSGGSEHPLDRYRARFTSALGGPAQVKLEVGYLDRLPLTGAVERNARTPFPGLEQFPVLTYTLEELAGMKLKTVLERRSERDLYDLASIVTAGVESDLVRTAFVVLSCTAAGATEEPLSRLRRRLAEWPVDEGGTEFRQSLREHDTWPPGEALERVSTWVGDWALTQAEREFLRLFHQAGMVRTAGLDSRITARLNEHPALLWELRKRARKA